MKQSVKASRIVAIAGRHENVKVAEQFADGPAQVKVVTNGNLVNSDLFDELHESVGAVVKGISTKNDTIYFM